MKKILALTLASTLLCMAVPALHPVTTRSLGSGLSLGSQMVKSALTQQGQTLFVGQNDVPGRSERTIFQAGNPFTSSDTLKAQLDTYHKEEPFPGVVIEDTVNGLQGICGQGTDGNMTSLLMLGFNQKSTGAVGSVGTLKAYYRRNAVSKLTDYDCELDVQSKIEKNESEKYHLLGNSDLSRAICYSLDSRQLFLIKVAEVSGKITLDKENLSEFWEGDRTPSSLSMTGDGELLYFPLMIDGSYDLYCLNLETKERIKTNLNIGHLLSSVFQVAVSGNGQFLACNDAKAGEINIFRTSESEPGTLKQIRTIALPETNGGVSELVFSSDGKYLAFLGRSAEDSPWLPYRFTVGDGLIEGACDGMTVETSCGGLNLSSDGKYLAFVSQEPVLTQSAAGTYQVCLADFGDESTENPLLVFTPKSGTKVSQAVSSSGREMLFLGREKQAYDVLHFWSEADGMFETVTDDSVLAMAIAGDGQRFAFAGLNVLEGGNELKVFSVTVSGLVEESPLDGSVYSPLSDSPLALSHHGQVLFCQDDEFSLLRVTWRADGSPSVLKIADATKTFDALFCNYDGQVLSFVEDNILKVWTAEMDAPLALATLEGNDQSWQLLIDGCAFLRCTSGGNICALSMTEPGKSQVVATLPDAYKCLAFSANGRFALIKRGDNALFRLNLTEQGASPEPLLDNQGQPCVLLEGAKATLNTSGTVACFQDERGLERFQMPAIGKMPSLVGGHSFSQQERCVYAPVTEEPLPLWEQDWRGAGLAVMPLLTDQPATGQVELLPPLPSAEASNRREHYFLRFFSDEEHYYGETGVSFRLFDGDDYSANLTFGVDNVNDAPVWSEDTIWTIETPFVEGEATSVPLPSISDYDPDDRHAYTVTNASPLLAATIVDQGGHPLLRLKPDFAATVRGEVREYEFTLTVQDSGTPPLQDTLSVKVSCQNKNQPPVMACGDLVRTETETGQMVFQWEDFQVSDGDVEDSETLRIVLESSASRKGTFHRRYGTPSESTVKASELSNGLLASDFPLLYVPDSAAVNKVGWRAFARDGEPSETAKVTLTFILARQSQTFGDIFGYHEPAAGEETGTWEKLQMGWNFLGLSFGLDSANLSAFCQAVGADCVWVWDNQKASYAKAQDLLAGQGFRVFVQRLPDSLAELSCEVVLPPSSGPLFEATPGWHLRGAVADGDFRGSRVPDFWMKCGLLADTLEDIANCPAGTVAWLFFGTNE